MIRLRNIRCKIWSICNDELQACTFVLGHFCLSQNLQGLDLFPGPFWKKTAAVGISGIMIRIHGPTNQPFHAVRQCRTLHRPWLWYGIVAAQCQLSTLPPLNPNHRRCSPAMTTFADITMPSMVRHLRKAQIWFAWHPGYMVHISAQVPQMSNTPTPLASNPAVAASASDVIPC